MADVAQEGGTPRQFRYLVSWTQGGQSGHKHIKVAEWKTPAQTQAVMAWIQEAFELDGLPVITSVFPMGEAVS